MPVIRVSKMGKCIQKLREERGWSLEELAGRILLFSSMRISSCSVLKFSIFSIITSVQILSVFCL